MKRMRIAFLVAIGLAALNGTQTLAQLPIGAYGSGSGVSASATESVTVKPEKLRLLMLIKAQGSDAKSAVASMNEHKEFVKKELEGMKADKDSIVFSPIRASTSDADANGNSRRMMQMQMSGGRGGKPATPKPLPTIYSVTCTLKADWPLPVKEGDALALLPVTLKEQIKSRDIAGDKNKPKLGKAEQEQLEEMEAMMSEQYSYGGEQNGQGPSITFIAKVPEEVQKKATAAAFKKAVVEIENASGATGVKLGKLTGFTSASVPQDPSEMYAARGYGRSQNVLSSGFLKAEEVSVSDENADELAYVVTVMVSYSIE